MLKYRQQQIFIQSGLFDQATFYPAFNRDLKDCVEELIIESPFITLNRISLLMPVLTKLRKRGVRVVINTRNPIEHDYDYQLQAEDAIDWLQSIGIKVLFTIKHHRKLAIIDRAMVWEGSLNILSHYDSCEIMRRVNSRVEAEIMVNFLKLHKYLLDMEI